MVTCHACKLRQQSLFRPLQEDELEFVSSLKTDHISLPARAEIIEAGSDDSRLYTLFAGWAFRYKRLNRDRRQILDFLLPGDLIGLEGALLGRNDHAVATLTPVSLCLLKGRPIEELFRVHPEFGLSLLRNLAEQQRRADNRLTSIGQGNGAQRLAYLLLEVYDRLRQRGMATGSWCQFPLQRQHLADALGMSGTHVNRSLTDLRNEGLATVANNSLIVHDFEKLAAFVNGYKWLNGAGKHAII